MKKVTGLLFVIVFSISPGAGYCQNLNLSFNHLSVNNGLSQGVNNCIFRDSKGYTWISSFDGLNRFDGIDCIVYRDLLNNPYSVKGTLFLNILEDKNNNLWIGSNEGLNFYNRKLNRFTCYYSPDGKTVNQTFSPFYIDNSNNIWVQSGQNIMLFNTGTLQFKKLYSSPVTGNLIIKTIPAMQGQLLQKILLAVQGGSEIAAAVADTAALKFNTLVSTAASPLFINTFLAEENNLWLGCKTGLFFFNSSRLTNIPLNEKGSSVPNVLQLFSHSKKTIWAGTEKNGLFYIDKENFSSSAPYQNSVYNPYTLAGNRVHYIYTDNENNLWVSVWGKGVDYVNLEKFRFQHFLTKPETNTQNADNFIRSIVEVKKNQYWCGTQLSGILVLDENKKIIKKISNGLPPAIEHIYKDSKGTVWIATLSGLFTITGKNEKPQPVTGFENFTKASNQFNYVYELNNGLIAASTNAGFFLIDRYGTQKIINASPERTSTDVYLTSFQSAGGDIFLSRAFKGFSVYRLQNDSLVLKKEFISQSTVKCFAEANDSITWIGTTRGLIRFNKTKLDFSKIYTTDDGLSNQYIYGILSSGDDLWLSTNSGISKFTPATHSFKNFTSNDGLQSNEFNTYSFCKTSNGELLFGGINGINAFYAADLKKDLSVPDLLLQKIRINDTAATSLYSPEDLDKLDLSFKQNTLSFQFAVIDYSNPQGCSFLYQLEGYDNDWITAANKSIIRYANLPPGNYILKAKAVNAEGMVNQHIYSLLINVATPWNKTWWFITLMSLSIAGVIWYLISSYYKRKSEKHKMQLEKELAIEQERTRMARELHDGLGSMLSGIKHSFSAMGSQLHLDEAGKTTFHSNINKLNESIKELRNISHSIAPGGLINYGFENLVRDYCNSLNYPGTLKISFKEIGTASMSLTEEQAFHSLRIIQELLQNIIKHSGAANAIVQLSYNNGVLSITVEDDGSGFIKEEAGNKKGMGLKNIESRVKLLKGKSDYKTSPGEGTSVFIEISCMQKT